jgi:hypothetical protein
MVTEMIRSNSCRRSPLVSHGVFFDLIDILTPIVCNAELRMIHMNDRDAGGAKGVRGNESAGLNKQKREIIQNRESLGVAAPVKPRSRQSIVSNSSRPQNWVDTAMGQRHSTTTSPVTFHLFKRDSVGHEPDELH